MKNMIDTTAAADEDMARTEDADEDKAEAHEEPEATEGKLSTVNVAPEEDPESQMLLTSENVGKHVRNLQGNTESLGEDLCQRYNEVAQYRDEMTERICPMLIHDPEEFENRILLRVIAVGSYFDDLIVCRFGHVLWCM